MEPFRRSGALSPEYPAYLRWAVPTLAVLLAVSLLLHFWTFYTLYRTRSVVKEQIGLLATQVETVKGETLRMEVPIKRTVPVNAAVPINESFTVPISTTFAFDDKVALPVLGTSIDVPIKANIPINTQVPVTINKTVQLSTTVDIDVVVPFELAVRNTPLRDYLDKLHTALLDLNERL